MVAHTYPCDPAFSLLFWEPWNSTRQIPEQALLDTWRSKSAFCLHQASNNISNSARAFHHNTGNLTLDGHIDRLRSQRGRGDHLKPDSVTQYVSLETEGFIRWEKQKPIVQSSIFIATHWCPTNEDTLKQHSSNDRGLQRASQKLRDRNHHPSNFRAD